MGELYSQAFATFGAAAGENETPFVGGHPGAEAVNTESFFLFGLVGSFHDFCIIAAKRGFVTEGYIYTLFPIVEKMGIIEEIIPC